MPALRIALVLVAVFFSLATSRNDPLPEPDLCLDGVVSGATSLELGGNFDDRFEAIADDDVIEIVTGNQGTDMLPLRYRVEGTRSECISVSLSVYRCEPLGARCDDPDARAVQVYELSRSLVTYPDGDGVATAVDFAVIDGFGSPGDRLLVEATAAGASTSLHIWADLETVIDAGTDAPADAGTDAPPPDATAPDAM